MGIVDFQCFLSEMPTTRKAAGVLGAEPLGEGVADKTGARRTSVRRVRTWKLGGGFPLPLNPYNSCVGQDFVAVFRYQDVVFKTAAA